MLKHIDFYDNDCPAKSALLFIGAMLRSWYGAT